MHITHSQLQQVLGGRKTQMRLPVRYARTATRPNGTTYTTCPFTPAAGATLTLREPPQGDRAPDPVHVTVLEASEQPLQDITFTDVLAEGHKTTVAFKVHWVHQHDRPWIAKRLADNDTLPDDMLMDRFTARHAATMVWAIRFELDRTERPRLLVPTGLKYGDDEGYTDNPAGAMTDEPEAIDETTLRWYCADAHDRWAGGEGRREKALKDEAQNLSRRLRQGIRTVDPHSREVAAQLQRIRDEIAALEALRPAA